MEHLKAIDWLIVVCYFSVVLFVGIYMGRREKNAADFYIGNRKIPWGAVLMSIIATEISAATFLGVPSIGYSENMQYLQFSIGSLVARFLVAYIFLSVFYASTYFSIYSYLADRFGNGSRYTTTVFFLITRTLASGVRLLLAAKGLSILFGFEIWHVLLVFLIITIIYTATGGIKAVIWTDVVQGTVFMLAGVSVFVFLGISVGWDEILRIGNEAGKFHLFNFTPTVEGGAWWTCFSDEKWFVIAFINGLMATTASLGTDQDMTQRMLACKDVKRARRSVISSGLIGIPFACISLLIGIGLFAYFQKNPDPTVASLQSDEIFPYFIRSVLPAGLKGFVLIGIIAVSMSSLDSTMSALSTSTMVEFVDNRKKDLSPKQQVMLSRILIIVFGIILTVFAFSIRNEDKLIWMALKITSITAGPMLGVFLLGILTKRGSDTGNVIAMGLSTVLVACLFYLIHMDKIPLGWTWLIVIGTASTMFVGALFASSPSKIPQAR